VAQLPLIFWQRLPQQKLLQDHAVASRRPLLKPYPPPPPLLLLLLLMQQAPRSAQQVEVR
jgi:hypothetical protein